MKKTIDVLKKGSDWIEQHHGYSKSLISVYQSSRNLVEISKRLDERPTVGLFGASQVGKSYMVQNLICGEDGRLLLKQDAKNDQTIDFLLDINPAGKGNESTLTVSRFSYTKNADEKHWPIKLSLFKPRDIICIFCDTFFSDLKDTFRDDLAKDLSIEGLVSTLKETSIGKGRENKSGAFGKGDVVYIRDYLEARFYNVDLIRRLRNEGYWEALFSASQRLSHAELSNACKILWGAIDELTILFEFLLKEMKKLEYADTVYVRYEALNRLHADGSENKHSLIDVTTLNTLFENNCRDVSIQLSNGQEVVCRADFFAVIVGEIHFDVSENSASNRGFIKNVDVLDFPGARTRKDATEITKVSLIEMVTRGKVAYSFNTNLEQYKVSVLCPCMRTSQTDINTVPGLVNEWVEKNIGKTPDERALSLQGGIPPLFVIFTWWNTQLFLEENDVFDHKLRLTKLFETRYRAEIKGDSKWHREWTGAAGFRNFYLLRDIGNKATPYARDEKNRNLEVGINPIAKKGQEQFLDEFRSEFINYHSNGDFFDDPATSFDEASSLNKDGSDYIIGKLTQLVKTDFNIHRLNSLYARHEKGGLQELKKHFHSSDSDKQLLEAFRKSSLLEDQLAEHFFKGSNGNMYYFGSFKELFNIKEDDLRDNFREILRDDNIIEVTGLKDSNVLEMKYAECLELPTKEERLGYLQKKYRFGSTDELVGWLKDDNPLLHRLIFEGRREMQKRSDKLAKEAFALWKSNRLSIEKFQTFIDRGISEHLLQYLIENFILGFEKLEIQRIISEKVSKYVDSYKSLDHAHDLVPHLAAGIINQYINCAGWDFMPAEDKHKVGEAKQALSQLAFEIPEEHRVDAIISKQEIAARLEEIDNLGELIKQDRSAIGKMPVVKNFYKWTNYLKLAAIANCDIPTYNVEANEQLGQILGELEGLKKGELTGV